MWILHYNYNRSLYSRHFQYTWLIVAKGTPKQEAPWGRSLRFTLAEAILFKEAGAAWPEARGNEKQEARKGLTGVRLLVWGKMCMIVAPQ